MADSILDLAPSEGYARVERWVRERGLPSYRAEQIARRLWINPIGAWNDATELPASLRVDLETALPLTRLEVASHQVSQDGTQKYLWRLADQEAIESVLIPSGTRRTLCISSQAGCALGASSAPPGGWGSAAISRRPRSPPRCGKS